MFSYKIGEVDGWINVWTHDLVFFKTLISFKND